MVFYKEHILPEFVNCRQLDDGLSYVSRRVICHVISPESASEQFGDIATFGCDTRQSTQSDIC